MAIRVARLLSTVLKPAYPNTFLKVRFISLLVIEESLLLLLLLLLEEEEEAVENEGRAVFANVLDDIDALEFVFVLVLERDNSL
jgi:hypothetical protein